MGFQIQVLETELEEERKRNKIDLSALDRELKSDYEAKLRAEMTSLRRVYEEQTEKAKTEFMYLHSAKVSAVVFSDRGGGYVAAEGSSSGHNMSQQQRRT